jgi:DNA-binding beta-propeller fold protein YncE
VNREISAERRGLKGRCGLGAILFVAIFLSLTASAFGKEIHVLTEKTIGAGELSVRSDSGIAVDDETGTLYVGDTGNGRVAKFNSSTGAALGNLGTFAEPTAIAVDNSAGASKGDVYVLDAADNTISKLTAAGALVTGWASGGHLSGMGAIAGIAVGGSGELWVYSVAGLLRSFSAAGTQATECSTNFEGSSGGTVGSISVDSTGRVYLLKGTEGYGTGVDPTDCSSEFNWLLSTGFAVDAADDSVFISQGSLEHVGRDHIAIEEGMGQSIRGEGLPRASQLAVRSSTGEVFVVVTGEASVRTLAVEDVEPPPVTIDPPTDVTGSTAKFSGTIDPEAPTGATLFAYESDWAFRCNPGCGGASLSGVLPGDAGLTAVEGTAEGLEPNTHYEVYLQGRNKGGVSRAPASTALSFTTNAVPPTATEPFPARVSDTEAVVAATITPGGAETSYEFEYVTQQEFEASGFAGAKKTVQSQVPASVRSEEVSAEIEGLQPETVYVFRVAAHNVVEGNPMTALSPEEEFTTYESPVALGGCGNEPFRVGLAAFLPDCRAYEQASPVDKNGGSVEGVFEVVQAASDGSGITFYSEAGMPGGVGAQDFPTYAASREGGSWSTRGMLPPQAMGKEGGFLGVTSNNRFALGWVQRYSEGGHAEITLVDRDLKSGTNTLIAPYMPPCSSALGILCSAFAGSSDDGEKIFIESYLPLTGETPPNQRNLYMWDEEAGTMTLVSVDEAGEPMPEGAMAGPYAWEDEYLQGGGAFRRLFVDAIHAFSADGSRAVFTEVGTGELFLRKGIGGPNPTTVNVSAPAPGSEEPGVRPAAFLEATPDGRYVFFKSPQRLTEDAGNGESFFSMNLYRYDVATGTLLDLTPISTDLEPATGPAVQGLLGTSSDGKVAYFAARGRLATAASVEKNNLYRYDEDATPHISLVATLAEPNSSPNDSSNWGSAQRQGGGGPFNPKGARVSADGRVLVFASVRSLTGKRTESPECEHEKCREFYRYTANTNQIECISCDPSGARPLGSATSISEMVNAALLPKSSAGQPLPRILSSDGNRLFFQTPDPLVARDTNSVAGCPKSEEVGDCQDVYEWEAAGTGSCHSAKANGGCLYLLSPGNSEEPSYLADVDPEGDNVFIFSHSQLVPADKDKLFDVYDVRTNGGLASQFAEPPLPCSSGEACQGQRAGSSPGATPGTSTFEGPGNEKPKAPKTCHKKSKKGKQKCKGSGKHKQQHKNKHKQHKNTQTTHRGGAK